jgi:hypothetical protein
MLLLSSFTFQDFKDCEVDAGTKTIRFTDYIHQEILLGHEASSRTMICLKLLRLYYIPQHKAPLRKPGSNS